MGAFKDEYYLSEDNTEIQQKIKDILLSEGWVMHYNDMVVEAVEQTEDDLENDSDIEEFCLYTEEDIEYDGVLNEFLFKKMVVRKGKKVKKWFSSDKNMQVIPSKDGGKPKLRVKKASEKIKRKKGALKAKIKRATKKAQSNIKRKLSNLKRSIFGIKRK